MQERAQIANSWPTVTKFLKIHECYQFLEFVKIRERKSFLHISVKQVSSLPFVFELWNRHSVTYMYKQANVGSAGIKMLFSSVS